MHGKWTLQREQIKEESKNKREKISEMNEMQRSNMPKLIGYRKKNYNRKKLINKNLFSP